MKQFKAHDGIIVDVRLFGSMARGDPDNESDLDILVVTDAGKPDTRKLHEWISHRYNANADLSIYSLERLKSMFADGHLFAWHLYQESHHLEYEDAVDSMTILGKPCPYTSAYRDVAELLGLLETIRDESMSSSSLTFEAGLIYVCTRNIALSASWYMSDGIKFGRNSPFEIERGELAFPLSRTDFEVLAACRHASTRGKTVAPPDRRWLVAQATLCHKWASEVSRWILEKEHVN
ncbi:Polymerase nucleotidyl transferase domain-containing protein [Burkholderia latens]|uniref:nucleotidyltransferase domain-containing protein n=1 Tax=Burkholderia latens TaxID=488446 RepID=UPI0039A4F62D